MKSVIGFVLFCMTAWAAHPARAQTLASTSAPGLSFRYEPAVSPTSRVPGKTGGDSSILIVRIELRDGWHINSEAPLDSFLVPTTLEISAPGMRFGKPVFPKADLRKSEVMGGDVALYGGRFEVRVPAKRIGKTASADSGATPGPTKVVLHYQACNDSMCLPPKAVTVEY